MNPRLTSLEIGIQVGDTDLGEFSRSKACQTLPYVSGSAPHLQPEQEPTQKFKPVLIGRKPPLQHVRQSYNPGQ